ncbi:MAG TPA: PKD domain-containing protein [Candidatus Cloacimonadota bacterium]|nr:PKD domain-containing protein [Candidatus Cloacimonadota bacterium]
MKRVAQFSLLALFICVSVLWGQSAVLVTDPATAVDFGVVVLEHHFDRNISLMATGLAGTQLTIDNIQEFGDVTGSFEVISAPTLPFTMMAGTTETITVRYSPQTVDGHGGTLVISPVSSSPKNLNLQGTGRSLSLMSTPASYDFGCASTTGSANFWIGMDPRYTMTSVVNVQTVTITGDPGFSIGGYWNSSWEPVTLPQSVMVGTDSLNILVNFDSGTTSYLTAFLHVTDEYGDEIEVPLTAFRGLVPAPLNYDFGNVTVGETGTHSIVLTAQGPAGDSLHITTLHFTPDDDFGFTSPYEGAMHLLSGETMTLDVGFFPVAEGPDSGILECEYTRNGESTLLTMEAPLYGTGVAVAAPVLSVNPDEYDFGTDITPGETGSVSFNVTRNPDYAGVTSSVMEAILTGDASFSLASSILDATGGTISLPYALDGSNMAVFTVDFEPWNTDPQHAVLKFVDNHGDSLSVEISAYSGLISVGPLIEVNPMNVVTTMSPSSVQSGVLSISNVGTDPLTYSIPAALQPPDVTVWPNSGTIAAGDSSYVQYTVNSSSMVLGTQTRTITIESNDYGHSPTTVILSITVTEPPNPVDFVGIPLNGHAALEVQFTDTSPIEAAGWRWDFENDGIIDNYTQNPLHTYAMPGVYSVRLVTISSSGVYSERIKSGYVTVTNAAPIILPGAFTEQEFMEDQIGGPYGLSYVFSDPDGDPLTYAVNGSDNIWGSVNPMAMLSLQATPNWSGTEIISVVAQDPFKGAVTHTFSVTVLPVNDPPALTVPEHLYFIRNSEFEVDFSQYITDADNAMAQLSISLERIGGWIPLIFFEYSPVNAANIPGQFSVIFTSQQQSEVTNGFRITVNDNAGRAVASADFQMHLLEHFNASVSTAELYQYTGQTVQFRDVTLGNPNYWHWDFEDDGIIDSNDPHPTHVYNSAGVYNVRLTLGHSGAQEEDFIFLAGYITMYGTSVTDDDIPPTWTLQGSPYNLFGDIVIGAADEIDIEPNVEVNLFGNDPLLVNGVLNANQARFKPQNQNGRWGGLKFQGSNQREPSELIGCEIVDALLPIDIEDASPLISGVTITVSDTTQYEDSRGIRIQGDSSPSLIDVELINYRQGVSIQNDGNPDRDTPTLTNIRVRNSSQTSRDDLDPGTGIFISGAAVLNTVLVDNFGSAIVIDGTENNTTPTLTNIRVRNSSQTSRGDRYGIQIMGGAVPSLEDIDIEDVSYGIQVVGGGDVQRDTPTLTNIRVRNSSQTSRSDTWGISIQDLSSIELEDAQFDGFDTGIKINAQTRVESTPTLTNIRVRNSSQTSRQENIGIDISGSVTAQLDDVIVEDYPFGIIYSGSLSSRDVSTPTLTNIRVRNSSQTSRNLAIGVQLSDLARVHCSDFIIEDYQIGLEISNDTTLRDVSTPTLTNIRVRNSSQTSRYENAGIFLGAGVGGTLTGAEVEEAIIGIFIADGNTTKVEPARIFNCESGIKAASSLLPKSLQRHLIVLEPAFLNEHFDWQFKAFELEMPGPWLIENNTINGLTTYVKAEDAGILFINNIAWTTSPSMQPFQLQNSVLNASYNDMFVSPPYPGIGNLALYPEYVNPAEREFGITYDSPCIDTGSPLSPKDEDGSRADMGAFPYLHRASMVVSQRFVQPNTQVFFTNTSLGHSHQNSFCEWDLNKDGQAEATSRDWAHTFTEPGVYNLRLRMHSGNLEDIRDYNAVVVVQSALLQGPPQVTIGRLANDIVLDWEPVTLTQQGDPVVVEYYLIYSCEEPDGYFDFVGNTQNFETIYTHLGGAEADKRFYFVLGFTGTMRELQQYIELHRRLRPSSMQTPLMRNKP